VALPGVVPEFELVVSGVELVVSVLILPVTSVVPVVELESII
jgi:hypothetical protein